MLTGCLGNYLLSFEPGPVYIVSLRAAAGSEEVEAAAMDAPISFSPLLSSVAPARNFGSNGFGVLVLLRMCCAVISALFHRFNPGLYHVRVIEDQLPANLSVPLLRETCS